MPEHDALIIGEQGRGAAQLDAGPRVALLGGARLRPVSPASLLPAGEDTSDHQNDVVWLYDMATAGLTRVFTTPYGAETTGPVYVSALGLTRIGLARWMGCAGADQIPLPHACTRPRPCSLPQYPNLNGYSYFSVVVQHPYGATNGRGRTNHVTNNPTHHTRTPSSGILQPQTPPPPQPTHPTPLIRPLQPRRRVRPGQAVSAGQLRPSGLVGPGGPFPGELMDAWGLGLLVHVALVDCGVCELVCLCPTQTYSPANGVSQSVVRPASAVCEGEDTYVVAVQVGEEGNE
jgi:hypothetical protein